MLKQFILTLAAGMLLAMTSLATADVSPTDSIRKSVEDIMALLKDKEMDRTTLRDKIGEIISKRFDFRAMSQRTLATNWKSASKEQQQEFVQLFTKLIENTYLGRIEAYTNEKVDFPGEKVKGKKAVVETLILTANADIPVDYRVYRKNDDWWVYDVIIEGVSLISNYRSSYQEIVKKEGFEGLIAKMKDKIKELEAQPEPA